jgi:hypothetical protein
MPYSFSSVAVGGIFASLVVLLVLIVSYIPTFSTSGYCCKKRRQCVAPPKWDQLQRAEVLTFFLQFAAFVIVCCGWWALSEMISAADATEEKLDIFAKWTQDVWGARNAAAMEVKSINKEMTLLVNMAFSLKTSSFRASIISSNNVMLPSLAQVVDNFDSLINSTSYSAIADGIDITVESAREYATGSFEWANAVIACVGWGAVFAISLGGMIAAVLPASKCSTARSAQVPFALIVLLILALSSALLFGSWAERGSYCSSAPNLAELSKDTGGASRSQKFRYFMTCDEQNGTIANPLNSNADVIRAHVTFMHTHRQPPSFERNTLFTPFSFSSVKSVSRAKRMGWVCVGGGRREGRGVYLLLRSATCVPPLTTLPQPFYHVPPC